MARRPGGEAWASLDLAHALTPIKLTVPGASATDDVFRALAKGQSRAYGIIEGEADADRVVVALAEPIEDGAKLKVSLIGKDRVGAIRLVRTYTVQDGDLAYTAETAAIIGLGVLEGRWKRGEGAAGFRRREPRAISARATRASPGCRPAKPSRPPSQAAAAPASASARSSTAWATGNRSAAAWARSRASRP